MKFPVSLIDVDALPNDQLEDQERDDNALFLSLQLRSLICFLNEIQYFWGTKDTSHVEGSFKAANERIKLIREHIAKLDEINSEVFDASWTRANELTELKYKCLNQKYNAINQN